MPAGAKLKGKRVLVTGGAARIGAELCRTFAAMGAKVVVHCHNSRKDAEELVDRLGGQLAGHKSISSDLSDTPTADKLLELSGPIDILINNASVFKSTPLAAESLEAAQTQFAINFWAPLRLMTAFHNQGIQDGCVINLLDQRIDCVDACGGSYTLSKKALADATVMAAVQWAPRTRVNAVAPGPVLPPRSLEGSDMRKELSMTPLGRRISMYELADACVYLATADSVTGQIVYVDGGRRFAAARSLAGT